MVLLDILLKGDLTSVLLLTPTLLVLGHVLYWAIDPHHIRKYPGPLWAKFTDLWLGRVAGLGHRSEVVHDLHKQYGE